MKTKTTYRSFGKWFFHHIPVRRGNEPLPSMYYTRSKEKNKVPIFFVPVNLDPAIFEKDHRQLVAYFLNLLAWKWICWQADERGWIYLKRDYITRVIPVEIWPEMRDRLIGKGVIYHSNTWIPGKQSQGYQIAPDYRKTKRIQCTNENLARRIRAVYASESVPLIPVHRWLEEKLSLIEFDMELAEKIIPTIEPDVDCKMSLEEYRLQLTESCKRITSADCYLTVDRFGRVHTPLTSLAKPLRACISVNGQRLIGLDLANSQPLIAGLVARQFYESHQKAAGLRNRIFDYKGNPYHKRKPECCEPNPKHPDLEQYLKVCEAGQLYESLMQPGDDRNRFKKQFLTVMYAKNHWKNHLKSLLTASYPSIAKMLKNIKKKDYRHAAHLMQNVEATIFVSLIVEKIQVEKPRLPIFTIHDSILTIPAAVEYVRRVILEEFEKLGVHPLLRTEEN